MAILVSWGIAFFAIYADGSINSDWFNGLFAGAVKDLAGGYYAKCVYSFCGVVCERAV